MTALAVVPRETEEAEGNLVLQIPVDQIDVGDNVRVNVDGVEELAESIKAHGLKQPIKVRASSGRWVVVWGQRRLLAHRMAGIERIPAIIADEAYTAGSLAIEQLVENLHRVDLPPLDRARAMRAVVDAGTSQADLARELGLHPSTIANDLGLLEAPAEIRNSIEAGHLTPAHSKALKGLAPKTQVELAARAVKDGLSAHETEQLVQSHKRTEEWEQQNRERSKADAEAKKAKLAEALERIAKRIPKDAPVHVRTGYYDNGASKQLADLVEKAGYTKVVHGGNGWVGAKKESIGCDCVAWQLETGYGSVTIREACTKRKHYDAKIDAESKARTAGYKLQTEVKAKLAEVLVDQVASLGPIAARVALWQLLSWNRDQWAKARDEATGTKRKKRDPWATITETPGDILRAEVTKRLAEGLADGDFKVDWSALAGELGLVETPA